MSAPPGGPGPDWGIGPSRPSADRQLATVHVGLGWFPEMRGGLNRYYYHLLRHLPAAGIAVRGLVLGTGEVSGESQVRFFAPGGSGLPRRWLAMRRELREELRANPDSLPVCHFAYHAFPGLP